MKLMQHHMILNWTGRISGLLITAFFAAFFIGEGMPDIINGKGKNCWPLFLSPCPAWLVISWPGIVRSGAGAY